VSGVALAFALGAAVLHALWNLLLARAEDPRLGEPVGRLRRLGAIAVTLGVCLVALG
jgi:hypothetical protein